MSKYQSKYVVLKLIEIGDNFMSPDWCGVHYLWQIICFVKKDLNGDAETPLVCTFRPYDAPVSCCFDRDRFHVFMVIQLVVIISPINFVLDTSARVSEFIVSRLIADTS